jgi:hypothetical protein
MNKLLTDWLSALRSGKYVQGTDKLRNNNTFCCLGVLCDVADPNGWDIYDDHSGQRFLPDPSVMAKLELPDIMISFNRELVLVKYGEGMSAVSELNDNKMPHAVIADLIEQTYKSFKGEQNEQVTN